MFCNVNDEGLFPAKEKIPCTRPQDHGQAEPQIVRHENEHEKIRENHLNHVQRRLPAMHKTQHSHLNYFLSFLDGSSIFGRDADGIVLNGSKGVAVEVFSVKLEGFVEEGEEENGEHGAE